MVCRILRGQQFDVGCRFPDLAAQRPQHTAARKPCCFCSRGERSKASKGSHHWAKQQQSPTGFAPEAETRVSLSLEARRHPPRTRTTNQTTTRWRIVGFLLPSAVACFASFFFFAPLDRTRERKREPAKWIERSMITDRSTASAAFTSTCFSRDDVSFETPLRDGEPATFHVVVCQLWLRGSGPNDEIGDDWEGVRRGA